MTDFATRFSQAKTPEEFGSAVGDLIRGTPGGVDPILALIGIATEMTMRGSPSQREMVAQFMRDHASAIDAGPQ